MQLLDRFLNLCAPSEEGDRAKSIFGAISFDEYSDGVITDIESDDHESQSDTTSVDESKASREMLSATEKSNAWTIATCRAAIGTKGYAIRKR